MLKTTHTLEYQERTSRTQTSTPTVFSGTNSKKDSTGDGGWQGDTVVPLEQQHLPRLTLQYTTDAPYSGDMEPWWRFRGDCGCRLGFSGS